MMARIFNKRVFLFYLGEPNIYFGDTEVHEHIVFLYFVLCSIFKKKIIEFIGVTLVNKIM